MYDFIAHDSGKASHEPDCSLPFSLLDHPCSVLQSSLLLQIHAVDDCEPVAIGKVSEVVLDPAAFTVGEGVDLHSGVSEDVGGEREGLPA